MLPLFCVADDAIEFAVGKIVQLFDNWRIGIDRSAGIGRRVLAWCSGWYRCGARSELIVRRGRRLRIFRPQPRCSRNFGLCGRCARILFRYWCRDGRRGLYDRLL